MNQDEGRGWLKQHRRHLSSPWACRGWRPPTAPPPPLTPPARHLGEIGPLGGVVDEALGAVVPEELPELRRLELAPRPWAGSEGPGDILYLPPDCRILTKKVKKKYVIPETTSFHPPFVPPPR